MSTPVIRKSWPVVALLTVGLIIAYVFGAIIVSSIVSSFLPGPYRHQKSIVATGSGEILIQHYEYLNSDYEQYYTDLDGERKEITATDSPQSLTHLSSLKDDEDYSSEQYRRRLIFAFLDREQRPRKWYFIVENDKPATGYFEVYDPLTNRRLFFVGRQGRSETRPTKSDVFELPRISGDYYLQSVLLINETPYYINGIHGTIPSSSWGSATRTGSLFDTFGFLRSGDNRVWQINFITGEVSPFLPELRVHDMKQLTLNREQLPADWTQADRRTESGIIVRTEDALVWYSLHEEKSLRAAIPKSLQQEDFSARLQGDNRVVYLTSSDMENQQLRELNLLWTDFSGDTIDEKKGVITQPTYQQNFQDNRWTAAAVVPGFLPFASLLTIMPVDDLAQREEITQAEARWLIVRQSTDVLLTLLVIGGLLAAWFYRACHARSVEFSWMGLAWIVLMGPFGYIILRCVTWYRRPALQPIESRPGIDIISLPQAG